jgi:hypothetical protein
MQTTGRKLENTLSRPVKCFSYEGSANYILA